MGWGNVVTAVFQRSPDPVSAFAHRRIRQPNRMEMILVRLDAGAIDLHLNDIGVDAIDRGAECLIKHVQTGEVPSA